MPYISLKNTNLYYKSEGKGAETLVFGHSMLFNLHMFDEQVKFLSDKYRCIRFDFRGHGQTRTAKDESDFTLESLTLDIVEFMGQMKIQPVHFIGFSMGGMVAMRLAMHHPELVKSLILIDTSSETEPTNKRIRNKLMLFVAKYFGLRPLVSKVMTLFFSKNFLQDPDKAALKQKMEHHFVKNERSTIVKAVKGVLQRKAITDLLHLIKQPTTIVVGANDQLTDLAKAEILHSKIKNSDLKIIPRSGHMTSVEEPELINKIILEHLENITS